MSGRGRSANAITHWSPRKSKRASIRKKALEESRGEFDRLQTHVHAINEEYSALRAELAGLDERARSEKTAAARIESQVIHLQLRREELVRDLERLGVERARLLTDNIELDQRAGRLTQETAEAVAKVEHLTAQEAEGRTLLATLDETLRTLRIESQAAQERRSEIELELVKKQAELRYLDETSRKELGVPASEVAAATIAVSGVTEMESPSSGEGEAVAGAVEGDGVVSEVAAAPVEELGKGEEIDESGVAEAEQRYQEVRTRIEALGPVNPQALEEFQEAQQRYEFLNTQRQDLLDSIRDTEKAIQELDTESRRRFKDAFEAINGHFREMFRTLFGGGQGEMRLTDETNLAESGIDILASPPGKRLQHVALLSGGEKSLTAMALLMAIFRYTPSPFCILDEVDAPLDEPNIERLNRLVKEMSIDTQFIVITHAKRTMEVAQTLYGVTMQEPGVSKLVSVKFEPMPQTAAPSPTAALAAV